MAWPSPPLEDDMSKPFLITSGLPYANGSIHLGHMVEAILTDVYTRALNMAGEEAYYVCADDTHGTPIELNAQKAGVPPEEFVARFAQEHVEDFKTFGIGHAAYYSTNSEENRRWAHEIYGKLKAGGHIQRRPMSQLYDTQAERFLPDRFVKGTCPNPKCGAPDQYGDVCEVCRSTYEPTDLIRPYSVVTGTTPELRESTHLFVDLSHFAEALRTWASTPNRMNPETLAFVSAWLEGGLKEWCISRDAPYFGFPIPDEPGKFFYVWLDAPIGYISATEHWARTVKGDVSRVDHYWREGGARIVHVIGKDITYFHTLFWPAMLHAAGLTMPERVHVHGMLMVNGEKMSKTRGTFINARTYAEHADPSYLRYYFASKLSSSSDDLDLGMEEMAHRVNAELINTIVNLVARGVPFLADRLGGTYGELPAGSNTHIEYVAGKIAEAELAYRAFDLASGVRAAVDIANLGNKLFQDGQPWKLVKEDPEAARSLVTLCLNIARAAVVVIAPAIPSVAARMYAMLGLSAEGPQRFAEGSTFDLVQRPVGATVRILERLEKKQLDAVVEASKPPEVRAAEAAAAANAPAPDTTKAKGAPGAKKEPKVSKDQSPAVTPGAEGAAAAAPKKPKGGEPAPKPAEITYDDFAKVDLRVGLVLEAKTVEGSDKLLELRVDLGEARGPRTILAGIRTAYTPEQVQGRRVAVVANLAPRKMRFGTSEGMIMAAGPGGKDIWLLDVPADAPPGSEIK
jgi:methionyl-tRNA synthetase